MFVEHLYLQQKYLLLASSKLEMFKRKSSLLWNFRCPYCGDSKKSKTKARGYIYKNKEGTLSFQCHNCGENHKFKNFLKFVSQNLYKEYILETLKENNKSKCSLLDENHQDKNDEHDNKKEWMKYLTPVSSFKTHLARKYLESRKIPSEKINKFWYSSNFKDFVDKIGLDYNVSSDPRIILVETDKFNNLKIVIARTLSSSGSINSRYYTLKIDKNYPKLFGLSNLNYTKPIYIVEGAIDSLFLDNCLATLDANLTSYKKYNLGIHKPILIWDNEPRNPNTCRLMKNAIEQNERVLIWPEKLEEKDINNMVQNGIDVNSIIKNRVFNGPRAILEFKKWSKI